MTGETDVRSDETEFMRYLREYTEAKKRYDNFLRKYISKYEDIISMVREFQDSTYKLFDEYARKVANVLGRIIARMYCIGDGFEFRAGDNIFVSCLREDEAMGITVESPCFGKYVCRSFYNLNSIHRYRVRYNIGKILPHQIKTRMYEAGKLLKKLLRMRDSVIEATVDGLKFEVSGFCVYLRDRERGESFCGTRFYDEGDVKYIRYYGMACKLEKVVRRKLKVRERKVEEIAMRLEKLIDELKKLEKLVLISY